VYEHTRSFERYHTYARSTIFTIRYSVSKRIYWAFLALIGLILIVNNFFNLPPDTEMSNVNGLPVYTALDEQRFNLWMSRLEDSYKVAITSQYHCTVHVLILTFFVLELLGSVFNRD